MALTTPLDLVIPTAHPGPLLTQLEPAAWAQLPAPLLAALLHHADWSPVHRVPEGRLGDAADHARLHATGLTALPGWPDAAWTSGQTGPQAWVTPCHWHMAQGQTLMLDPQALALDDATSCELMRAMQPYAAEDGLTLDWHSAWLWRLSGHALSGWASHSLSQVLGQDLQTLLQTHPWPAPLGRLHIEMQMLFYAHPCNEARAAAGLQSVNSFWLHGVGEWPASLAHSRPNLRLIPELDTAWRHGQTSAWLKAWNALDEPLHSLLQAHLLQGATIRVHWCSRDTWRSATLTPEASQRRHWSWPWQRPIRDLALALEALQSR